MVAGFAPMNCGLPPLAVLAMFSRTRS